MRGSCQKLIVVLLSGRPLILTDQLPLIDALVAAWLPGTEGRGVADVLFGDEPFSGRLPYSWPRGMDQVPLQAGTKPLFSYDFGLQAGTK
jgi:beta-glucosidase